jgi:hypothetical protein
LASIENGVPGVAMGSGGHDLKDNAEWELVVTEFTGTSGLFSDYQANKRPGWQ